MQDGAIYPARAKDFVVLDFLQTTNQQEEMISHDKDNFNVENPYYLN